VRQPSQGIRERALRALDRVSLLRPAYRSYEVLRALRAGDDGPSSADGLPLPPARLRIAVAGTPDAGWFLESGRQQAAMIRESLDRHGRAIAELERLLDFGCGCGRVTRHWAELAGPEIHGSDYNRRLVRWCVANLTFGRFGVNRLAPPLSHPDEFFGAVYGISVVTHLPEELERKWIAELARVLTPGGLLLLTTHGERYADRLTADERARFAAGEVVVRWASVAGTNLCTTFHPERYVRDRLAPELELLEFAPGGAAVGAPPQDLVVLRKPAGSAPAATRRSAPVAPTSSPRRS
jgi:SAM-dependent methyltransferase